MGNKKGFARIIVVTSCARPHIVIRKKNAIMMDAVGIALPICFRIRHDPTCEEKHLGEIWGDVYHRQIVFIRFNTDEYKDGDGNNVPSPWGVNGLGVLVVRPKWKAAREVRLDDLSLTVEHYIKSSNIKKEFELVHSYY